MQRLKLNAGVHFEEPGATGRPQFASLPPLSSAEVHTKLDPKQLPLFPQVTQEWMVFFYTCCSHAVE